MLKGVSFGVGSGELEDWDEEGEGGGTEDYRVGRDDLKIRMKLLRNLLDMQI
jgi:hypothetical protein